MKKILGLSAALMLSGTASAAPVIYQFTGGGGIDPNVFSPAVDSGWLVENATSFPGLSPSTVLDNGVSSVIPGNWLDGLGGGAPFDGTYSGTVTVDGGVVLSGTLSWTGTIGFEASGSPGTAGVGFYAIGLQNGSYDLVSGAYSGSFDCVANPGGLAPGACAAESVSNHDMPLGTLLFADNGDGTVSLTLGSDDFTQNGGVKDNPPGAGNGSADYNHRLSLTLDAAVVPVPAAVWLFGSALGLLAWVRRRAA